MFNLKPLFLTTLLILTITKTTALIDIIGYYGNSGNSISSIPKILEINDNYNILIVTFASVGEDGSLKLEIQGPYENDLGSLAGDIKKWKSVSDKWGRTKKALISIGGANGK